MKAKLGLSYPRDPEWEPWTSKPFGVNGPLLTHYSAPTSFKRSVHFNPFGNIQLPFLFSIVLEYSSAKFTTTYGPRTLPCYFISRSCTFKAWKSQLIHIESMYTPLWLMALFWIMHNLTLFYCTLLKINLKNCTVGRLRAHL